MPVQLDKTDHAIIEVLVKDGRKSFRQIARETGISTPTAKARYIRMINVGFLKSVSPVFDLSKIESKSDLKLYKNSSISVHRKNNATKSKIGKNVSIRLQCDLCEGSISGEAHIFKFADYERFFCCTQCRATYKEKYMGRIEALTKRYEQ
ncbi:MAG TPA: AsnC family transcriptional regulator [Nitrososphaeraceae archaeon]|jgi:Lrp/AsnC family leucine-responsive transcriptional regulator